MPRIVLRGLACVVLMTLGACTSSQEQLQALASARGAVASVIHTPVHEFQTVAPSSLPRGKPLTVYIEGDGHAWATATQPSLDPSPHSLEMARLALEPEHPGVYLARPCQFVMNERCATSVWTDARFSPRVVAQMQVALDQLKARYQAPSLELIGYSGGAAMALLLAAHRDDVTRIQTIAGNLDPYAWVQLKNLSPLTGSDDPLKGAARLSNIPQRHFIGAADTIIPASLTQGYLRKVQPACAEVVTLPGTHASVVAAITAQRLDSPIVCGPNVAPAH
jgi:poly(3-hydroxybutyrate) depolymerase